MADDLIQTEQEADDGVWSATDTNPEQIAHALRELLKQRHSGGQAYAPARVLNLVVIADAEWRGEVRNRLDRVGRYHASRTILCDVEPGRRKLDAWATMTPDERVLEPGETAIAHELVELRVGERHIKNLRTVIDPLVVTDLPTLVWAPHGHQVAVDALMDIAQVVLIDSDGEPDPEAAAQRATGLAARSYIVDLTWLRSTPWRERVASTFDPPKWRCELEHIDSVTIRHKPDSVLAGLLFSGWLCHRLGWRPEGLERSGDELEGHARAGHRSIRIRLEQDPTMTSPGLAGVTLASETGMSIALNRGSGGLSADRVDRDGKESSWTLLGASRGESGILGEGIRQALLRDPGYGPALSAASRFAAALN